MKGSMVQPFRGEGKQAILPETLDIFRVGDMWPGEIRYARTYAMRVTQDRLLWLDSTHPTSAEPTMDMPMMITRTEEGYSVDISDVADPGWGLDNAEKFDEMYGEDVEWIPVVHLVNMPKARDAQ